MEDSFTNLLYGLINYMEKEKKKLYLAVVFALIIIQIGLIINIATYLSMRYHIKILMDVLRFFDFGPRGSPPFFVILNFISSIIMIYVGVKILLFLRNWEYKLKKINEFEKQTFEDVMENEKIGDEKN
ncbi:MAG: hypothetical protein AMQ74_00551 [Candidatus Methanofastidiosum methylothiophilum]|uniref:Uncharacterized protein n=1 Tax=Candidatus Methanofastidiosum methylothiophilum TaxID=1705564 RepID=A0A150J6V3_9EURY|nr:MAG: hypothetical protein AMQ74_00551 [Candidatus Methanofastidiosum methylthiophilus]NMC76714.1 hypothetical protein [Candidatus Methanofastidiosa archaeon]